MIYNLHFIIFAAMFAMCVNAGAQKIYEDVDQKGVVEFSDHPSSGAKEIDVKPNVVDVAPVEPIEPSTPTSATGAAEAPASSAQPEVIREGAADDYYGDYENRREKHRERKERMEHREGVVRQPVHKEALGRDTAREGAHRR